MNPPQKPPRKPARSGPDRPSLLQASGYATISNTDVQATGPALHEVEEGGGRAGGRRTSTNPFDDDDDSPIEIQFAPQASPTAASTTSESSSNSSGSGRGMNKRRQQLRSLIGSAKNDGLVEEKREITSVDRYDDLTIIRFLTNERVYGYPGTKGTFLSNFWQFVLNSHPLLSIFFVHPLHPFTRLKRFIVFLCSFSFAIAVSFIFVSTDYVPDLAMCRDGCEHVSYVTNQGKSIKMCNYSYRDSISYSDYHDKCRYFRPWQLTAISGIIIVIFGLFLKFIATCSCFQGKAAFQEGGSNRGDQSSSCSCCSLGFWCRKLVEACGGLILTVSSGACLILLCWTLLEAYRTTHNVDIIGVSLISKLWSFFEWFFYSLPMFAFKYPMDKRHFNSKIEKRKDRVRPIGQNGSNIELAQFTRNPI